MFGATRGAKRTLKGSGCVFADGVNARSSIGCSLSSLIVNAHCISAVLRNTDLHPQRKTSASILFNRKGNGTHAVAMCCPGHTRRPFPKLNRRMSSRSLPSPSIHRCGLNFSGSGKYSGSRPRALYAKEMSFGFWVERGTGGDVPWVCEHVRALGD